MPRQHAFPMLSLRSVSMLVLRVHVCEGMDLGRKVFRSWWVLSWQVCHEGLKAMAPREMMVMPVHSQARFQGYLASLLALPESIESIDFWLVDPEKMDRTSEFAYMFCIYIYIHIFVASVKTDRLPFANMEKKYCNRSNHENAMGKIHLSHQPCNHDRLFIPNQWNPHPSLHKGKNTKVQTKPFNEGSGLSLPPHGYLHCRPMGTKKTSTPHGVGPGENAVSCSI